MTEQRGTIRVVRSQAHLPLEQRSGRVRTLFAVFSHDLATLKITPQTVDELAYKAFQKNLEDVAMKEWQDYIDDTFRSRYGKTDKPPSKTINRAFLLEKYGDDLKVLQIPQSGVNTFFLRKFKRGMGNVTRAEWERWLRREPVIIKMRRERASGFARDASKRTARDPAAQPVRRLALDQAQETWSDNNFFPMPDPDLPEPTPKARPTAEERVWLPDGWRQKGEESDAPDSSGAGAARGTSFDVEPQPVARSPRWTLRDDTATATPSTGVPPVVRLIARTVPVPGDPVLVSRLPPTRREAFYRDAEQQRIGARREVPAGSGIADLVSRMEIVEVKVGRAWRHALGQVLAYGHHHPSLTRRIHLYDVEGVDIEECRQVCAVYGVSVSVAVVEALESHAFRGAPRRGCRIAG